MHNKQHEKVKVRNPIVTKKLNVKQSSKLPNAMQMELNENEPNTYTQEQHNFTTSENEAETRRNRITVIKNLIRKLKDIAISNANWEDKIITGLKIILEECRTIFLEMFREIEWFKGIYNIFFYGQ